MLQIKLLNELDVEISHINVYFMQSFLYSKDLEEEIRKKIDQVAHAQNSATKFLQEELEAKSQVSGYYKKLKI